VLILAIAEIWTSKRGSAFIFNSIRSYDGFIFLDPGQVRSLVHSFDFSIVASHEER